MEEGFPDPGIHLLLEMGLQLGGYTKFEKQVPANTRVFFRIFLLHNDFKSVPLMLDNISAKLNYLDSNQANLVKTVEQSILVPLRDYGLITSYEKVEGLAGIKFVLKRNPGKNNP